MYCPKCARIIADDSKFCEYCGRNIEVARKEAAEAAQAQSTPDYSAAAASGAGAMGLTGEYSNDGTTKTFSAEIYSGTGDTSVDYTNTYNTGYSAGSGSSGQTGPTTIYYSAQPAAASGDNGLGIASMVCGILSVLCCSCMGLGILLGIAAIVMGAVNYKKAATKGYAIAGLVTGIVGVVFGAIMIVSFFSSGAIYEIIDAFESGMTYRM